MLEAGELDGARQLFADVVATRRAELRPEELVSTLAALATIEQEVGRERQALDWWVRALVPADTVVIAEGLAANPDPLEALRASGVPVVSIGDVDGVGYIEGAIHQGFRAAVDL